MVTYYSYTIIAGIHGGPSNDNILFLCYYSWYMEALPMVTYYSYTYYVTIGKPSMYISCISMPILLLEHLQFVFCHIVKIRRARVAQ
jgi:hypothetical protein